MSSSASAGPATAADASANQSSITQSRALPYATRARLALFAVAGLVLAAGFWLWTLWHALKLQQGRYDFSQYYAAGYALRHNPHAAIYSQAFLNSTGIAAHVLARLPYPYPYPPLSAILFAPLTLLSFSTAATIFLFLNAALWLASMLLIASEIRQLLGASLSGSPEALTAPSQQSLARLWQRVTADPAPLVALSLAALLLFLSRPAVQTLGDGQINFAVLLPLAAIPWLARRGHERWLGVAVAIAAMLKVTPALLLAYLVLRRRWQALGTALVALAALALASIAVVGPAVFFQAPAAILGIGGKDMALRDNESLFGPALNALAAATPAAVTALRLLQYLLLAALAAAIALVIQTRRTIPAGTRFAEQTAMTESLAYAVALPAIVLLSPVAWAHHYVWLAPAAGILLAVALRAWAESPAPARQRALLMLALAALACVLVNLPLPNGWDTDPNVPGLLFGLPLRPWFQELRPLGGLLVIAVAALLLTRTRLIPALALASWRLLLRNLTNDDEQGANSSPRRARLSWPRAIQARLQPPARTGIIVIAAALLLTGIIGWLVIVWKAIQTHTGRFDFSAYYAAGRALRLDPHANIYSPTVLAASSIAGHVLAPPNQPYLYPPLPALLFAPLTLFTFTIAADIFLAINILVWLLGMLLIAREVRHLLGASLATGDKHATGWLAGLLADPAPLVALGVCAPLFFLGRPGEWTLGNGQINFLVLLPLAAVPWLTRRGNERGVGVAIALATMLKLTPGVLLLYLLLRRRWQALGAALIALAALALLSLLIVGPQVFLAFPGAVLRTGNHAATQSHNEALFAPVIYALTTANVALASPARLCEYALLGMLAVELGVILWRTRPARPSGSSGSTGAIHLSADALRREALAYALALPAVVLLSPTAWAHHYVWLLPAAAIVVGLAIRALATHPAHTSGRRALLALLIGAVLAGVLLNVPLPNGWDTDPTALQWLFGLPLRPWFQELRPLGGLLVIAIAATLLPRGQAAISPPESHENDRQVPLLSVRH